MILSTSAIQPLLHSSGPKISQAELLKVRFETNINDMNKMELGVKSLDMTQIFGNLIDNAYDEVMNYPEEERIVRLQIGQKLRVP